ncbi:MAG: hypothetical protein ABR529_04355 [Actinomycetota bacterium]
MAPPFEPRGALLQRRVQQVVAVEVEKVEEERHNPLGRPALSICETVS